MDDFVARPSRWRIVLIILGCAGFVLGGFWLTGAFGELPESSRYSPTVSAAIGWIAISLFGFFGLAWCKDLLDAGEKLRISASGIRWTTWSDEVIPWTEITDVTTWDARGQKWIILHLQDASRFPSRGIQASFVGINRALTSGDIAITLTGTDRRFDDAMAAVAKFRK